MMAHCGQPCSPEPVLIPPTWNKTQHHGSITRVWARAARELSEAENIVIVGYSMPETDQFFRYLIALGTVGTAFIRNVLVCDPDANVSRRFEALLSSATRTRLFHLDAGFADAVGELKNRLKWGMKEAHGSPQNNV
jgi:hypothetical protein